MVCGFRLGFPHVGKHQEEAAMGEKSKPETSTDPRSPNHKVPLYQSDPAEEDKVEVASEDSFPASDPPSYTSVRHPGKPRQTKPQ